MACGAKLVWEGDAGIRLAGDEGAIEGDEDEARKRGGYWRPLLGARGNHAKRMTTAHRVDDQAWSRPRASTRIT